MLIDFGDDGDNNETPHFGGATTCQGKSLVNYNPNTGIISSVIYSWQECTFTPDPVSFAGASGGGGQAKVNPKPRREQKPWYKNACVTDALKTGTKNIAIDAIGFIPEAGGVARMVGHQAGYKGIVADRYGSNMIRAAGKTAGFDNSAVGFSTGDWTSWVSAGITALDYVPVVNEFTTTAALSWDAGVTAYKVYQCPK